MLQTGLLLSVGQQIAELAAVKRLPTVYGYREHVLDGGLISYGVDLRWCYHRGAYFVDKILHGTPPGELPVEFPTKMMLSINLKTANQSQDRESARYHGASDAFGRRGRGNQMKGLRHGTDITQCRYN